MFISVLCFIISCLIIRVESPQLFVIYLLFQSGLIVFLIRLVGGIWYAYILFLVFLGGILILFVYTRSLTSEIKLDYRIKKYFIVFSRGVVIFVLVKFRELNLFLRDLGSLNVEIGIVKELISKFRGVLYLYIVGYLLLALYNVCWMIKIFEGPLQKFTYWNS